MGQVNSTGAGATVLRRRFAGAMRAAALGCRAAVGPVVRSLESHGRKPRRLFEPLEPRIMLSAVPAPFSLVDIGNPAIGGSVTYSEGSNQYQLTAAGTGLGSGGTADQASMVAENWTGAGSLTADIGTVGATGGPALAGVMFRDTSAAGSEMAVVGVNPGGQVVFDYRGTTGGAVVYYSELTYTQPGNSTWVRLSEAQSGSGGNLTDNFTAYASQDGSTCAAPIGVQFTPSVL